MADNWSVEDIFIQLIIEETPLTLDELETVIKYLNGDISLVGGYNKWERFRDECIKILERGEPISINSPMIIFENIDEAQLKELKYRIESDEIGLLNRTYKIAYNEAIHADDELWDDR